MYRFRIFDIKNAKLKEAWIGEPRVVTDKHDDGTLHYTFDVPLVSDPTRALIAESASQAFFMYCAANQAFEQKHIRLILEPVV